LSVTVTLAESLVAAAGENVMESVQLLPAVSVDPQVDDMPNEEAFVPPSTMLVKLSVAVPLLVRVTVEGALVVAISVGEKATLVGEMVSAGAVPVPLSATVCGEPVALSATESVAWNEPLVNGVKPTVMVQLALTARVAAQLLVWLNAEEAVPPPMLMAMPVSAAVPVLVSETV
jgi:hypothetical protein